MSTTSRRDVTNFVVIKYCVVMKKKAFDGEEIIKACSDSLNILSEDNDVSTSVDFGVKRWITETWVEEDIIIGCFKSVQAL